MSTTLLAAKIVVVEEEPQIRTIAAAPTAVTGVLGTCMRGPIGVATLVTSWAQFVQIFGDYTPNADVPLAAQGFFTNGGQQLWVVRTVHYSNIDDATTATSAEATVTISTNNMVATHGITHGTAGPWALAEGQTIVVAFEAGGNQTFTVHGAAAARVSGAGTFNVTTGDGYNLTIGGVSGAWTLQAGEVAVAGAATAAEIKDSLNSFFASRSMPALATVTSTTHVTVTTNKAGLGASINFVSAIASGANLAFTTGALAGTGNVQDLSAVVPSDITTVTGGITNGTYSVVGGLPTFTSATTGLSSTAHYVASSTASLGFDTSVHTGVSAGVASTLTVEGKTDGTYANNVKPTVAAATNGVASNFNFTTVQAGVIVESYPNVSMDPAAANYIVNVVNNATTGSKLVVVTDLVASSVPANNRPANGAYTMTGGNDGLSGIADTDYNGSSASKTGMRAFDNVNTLRLLIVPNRATSGVQNAMLTYCEIARNMTVFAIMSCPAGLDGPGAVTYVTSTALLQESSEFGAIYWPRVQIVNPSATVFGSAANIVVDPVGHIAGLYAANDTRPGGVYEAPAGISFGKLQGVVDLETADVKDENIRDLVFPQLINPITVLPGTPIHIDGARTLKSTGNFPTIGERRGVIFIETSITNGLLFAKHRKIKPALLAQLDRAVRTFLLTQLRNGAFASDDPKTAYFVDFSAALNPPSQGQLRTVNGRIGLATAKPAEYIVLRVSQDQRALEEELAQTAAAA